MLKEAVIWALLITGSIFSYHAFFTIIKNDTKAGLIGLFFALIFGFSFLFCSIYMIFRFFWWTWQIPGA